MIKFKVKSSGVHRTGGELFFINIPLYDESNNIIKNYEIWITREALEDRLKISSPPTKKDLEEFGKFFMGKWMEKEGRPPRKNDCVLITNKAAIYGNFKKISKALANIDQMVRTNISLPASLHEWLRIESAKGKKSISEIIRRALVKYRKYKEPRGLSDEK